MTLAGDRNDPRIGRRALGGGHFVEVRADSCGLLAYAEMRVPVDWTEAPLNRCHCGKPVARWTMMLGSCTVARR